MAADLTWRRLAVFIVGCGLAGVVLAVGVLVVQSQMRTTVLGQPISERRAQGALPHSDDAIWDVLKTTAVTEDAAAGDFDARFPPAVKALAGRRVSISGFVLPLEAKVATTHFLLSKYTPVCAFCPPGEPNEVVEVFASGPLYPDTSEITVTGRFSLQNDGKQGLFFRLDQADFTG